MKIVLSHLWRRVASENLSFLAGGVAFYSLLAFFPAMAALVSLFGLVAEPNLVRDQLQAAQPFFPPQAFKLIETQLLTLTSQPHGTLSLTVFIGLALALFAATRGTKAMLAALNSVFRVTETRAWWLRQTISFLMTLGGILLLCLALLMIVAIPLMLRLLPAEITLLVAGPFHMLRWMVLAFFLLIGLIALFALGPCRTLADHSITTILIGAVSATAVWIAGAIGGSWFVTKVPTLHAAYGSLSAVIVLMLWMLVSAYAVLFGAAVTATLDQLDKNTDTAA